MAIGADGRPWGSCRGLTDLNALVEVKGDSHQIWRIQGKEEEAVTSHG